MKLKSLLALPLALTLFSSPVMAFAAGSGPVDFKTYDPNDNSEPNPNGSEDDDDNGDVPGKPGSGNNGPGKNLHFKFATGTSNIDPWEGGSPFTTWSEEELWGLPHKGNPGQEHM